MGTTLKGLPASPGIAVAPAFALSPAGGGAAGAKASGAARPSAACPPEGEAAAQGGAGPAREWESFKAAVAASRVELEALRDSTRARLGELKAEIFDAHLSMLRDPELEAMVSHNVLEGGMTAPEALASAVDTFSALLEDAGGELFAARADDLRDLGTRIACHLSGHAPARPELPGEVVVVAECLTPSETACLDPALVRAFVTSGGSLTSHSTILARSMEIPAVVGVPGAHELSPGSTLIVDGTRGLVIVDPTEAEVAAARREAKSLAEAARAEARYATGPTLTKDGHVLELVANVGGPGDSAAALAKGAEGVGLFRTEYLFMDRADLPSEEEQLAAYRAVLEAFAPRPVTIRTLDIGGDKEAPALALPREDNPFLGVRALRLCLEREGLFRTQLRALLRAAPSGRLRIMFPMVATLGEFREARRILVSEREALVAGGLAVPALGGEPRGGAEGIEVGVMIEIPAAAAMADLLAREADFFSVGTNDLTQYLMAADRMNPRLARLSDPLHPAVLRVMGGVAEAARAHGRKAAVCGEMAADPAAAALLVGMGYEELSMGAASIPRTRAAISRIDREAARGLWLRARDLEGAEEVRALVAGSSAGKDGPRT